MGIGSRSLEMRGYVTKEKIGAEGVYEHKVKEGMNLFASGWVGKEYGRPIDYGAQGGFKWAW